MLPKPESAIWAFYIDIIIIHFTNYLEYDWLRAYSEFSVAVNRFSIQGHTATT